MAKYQQYEEYKDSGVEWLGKIPSHWNTNRHKYIASFIKGKNPTELFDNQVEGYLPYLSMDSLRGKLDSKFAPFAKGLSLSSDGQPLIIWDGSNAGEFILGKKGILSSTMSAAYLNFPLDSRYYWYLCICIEPEMRRHANGMGIPHVNGEELKNINLAIPKKLEQTQIANFLDHETAQIDTLIEKQQTLIQLLKEKRQAVISHAVTKGLNPDAPMKDSGVEWLGEVPEHWDVKRVRHVFDIDNNLRTPINRQSRLDMEGEFRYYGPTGVLNLINRYNVEGQYFLLGEDGDHFLKFEEKSMTIYVEGKFNVNNHAHLIKGKGACSTKWGCLYFEHKDLFPWLIKQGVGRYKLQKTVLLDIPVAIPPLDEQEFILNAVNKKKNNFSEIEKRTEALINLLKERRTALISAAVTGKIDVRGWRAADVIDDVEVEIESIT